MAQAQLPTVGIIHSRLDPHTSTRHQDNAPQISSQAKLMETILQLKFPLPRCVKLMMRPWLDSVSVKILFSEVGTIIHYISFHYSIVH